MVSTGAKSKKIVMPITNEFVFEQTPDSINRGICTVIYCDPGLGKTSLIAGTPDTIGLPVGETLTINTDAGLGPFLGTGHIVFNVTAEGFDEGAVPRTGAAGVYQLESLHRWLYTQEHPFKYVVLDNISELEQLMLLTLTRKRGKVFTEIKEYGDNQNKLREWLHLYRDLIYRGITVVFMAWEFPLEIRNAAGSIITRTYPKIAKKIAPDLCGFVDVVGHLEVDERTQRRWIRLAPNDQYIAKCQFKGVQEGEEACLMKLFDKIKGYDYGKKE